MNKPLRVLILEDNPVDAELMQMEMRQAGMAVTARVAEDEVSFIREFGEFTPDIILSDYDLPTYTGALALAEVQRRCPDVPFILVTGAVTEDRAIEILTSGAKDFVMKNRLHKLVSAMRRAIAEAEEHKARRKAEREAHAASLYARSLIEASLDPLVTISAEGKITDVNIATEEVTGFSRVQLIGTDFSDYFTDPAKARAGYEKVFSEGSVKDHPLAIRHTSGRITEVLYNASVYRDENGVVQGVFAAARDITELKKAEEGLRKAYGNLQDTVQKRTDALEAEIAERKRVEEKLRQSERNLSEANQQKEDILESISDCFYALDKDLRFTYLNKAAEEIWSLSRADIIGRKIEDVFAGLIDMSLSKFNQVLEEQIPQNYEVYSKVIQRWGEMNVYPSRDGISVYFHDITERKRAEEALQASEEKFSKAFMHSPTAVTITRLSDGRIIEGNESAYELFGYTHEEVLGKTTSDLNIWANSSDRQRLVAGLASKGFVQNEEFVLQKKDKTPIYVNLSASPITIDNQQCFLCSFVDISESKKAVEDQKRKTAELESTVADLDSFAYSVSHDLRAPLRAIDGYSQMLLKEAGGRLDPDDARKLQMISKNSEKMGRLIDDLLQLSRTVRVEMRFGPISMKSVVEDTWREIRAGNPDRKMEIIIGDLPPARGDLTLLRQAFSNLIGNAVKFTKNRNKAVIHVTGFPADGFNTYCVRDNGAGFDMKYYDKLFEVFRRLHSESQYEGTGVGLAIVKKIVEKHGGRIWAESKPDEGAAFYLTLPA